MIYFLCYIFYLFLKRILFVTYRKQFHQFPPLPPVKLEILPSSIRMEKPSNKSFRNYHHHFIRYNRFLFHCYYFFVLKNDSTSLNKNFYILTSTFLCCVFYLLLEKEFLEENRNRFHQWFFIKLKIK